MVDPRSIMSEVNGIIDSGEIRAVYQPIVDLDRGGVVAYESLARGPEGSRLERPDLLFEAARACGRVADLDWLCRAAAVRGALQAGLGAPFTLFLNVEPDALHKPVPQSLKATWLQATERLRVMLEITERALTDRPTELLWSVEWARELGWGVALDDVGADPRSLAMLPFLRPDVIKLDLRLIQQQPTSEMAGTIHAVAAEAERTGAVILAEGIETDRHLETARAMGACLGQGWLLGRPAEMPSQLPQPGPGTRIATRHWEVPVGHTPYDIISRRRPVRRGNKRMLFAMSRALENAARDLPEKPVILSTFQDERFFTHATRDLYARLAHEAAFVAAFGVGLGPVPAPGIRGARLFSKDPLRGEWVVVVLGAHFAAAFAARDLGDDGPDPARRFDHVMTYDRDLVIKVALSLMARVLAL
ncbi:hypothetical protein BH24ACT26_BH24ACT26_14810 [soil metagenome]